MSHPTNGNPRPESVTDGHVIHSAWRYDLSLRLRTRGRERAFRDELLGHAGIASGSSVADIGCGTGTLAIAAAGRAGPSGAVFGIDPAPEMIARARRKGRRAGVGVRFETGVAEELPFDDASLDVVMMTLVLHQLTDDGRHRCVREIRRVLRPAGRLLLVDIDMGDPSNPRRTSHSHGGGGARFSLDGVIPLLSHMGMNVIESGSIGFRIVRIERMRYVVAEPADRSLVR